MADKKKRTRGVSYTHVVMGYLDTGVKAVDDLHQRGNLSGTTIRTAIRDIVKRKGQCDDLQRWYEQTLGGRLGGGRGITAPVAGETRLYKAQVQKLSPTAFIKLPIPSVGRGTVMEAFFGENGTVTVAPRTSVSA